MTSTSNLHDLPQETLHLEDNANRVDSSSNAVPRSLHHTYAEGYGAVTTTLPPASHFTPSCRCR